MRLGHDVESAGGPQMTQIAGGCTQMEEMDVRKRLLARSVNIRFPSASSVVFCRDAQ
jgi:hypothetical protein